ncbi:Serine/threonine-protein kinase pim-3 [Desmophyllum pertusum]|uniref:Serine/threonine-protein kinase 1 n=1 Tax=Desmophyllum pertusum TaxID=174260 RepID=A0A9X0CEM1_9CNID|nr:Serine/threonine-protein kinase pim-3 [Desmophyllum pertusum]
MNINPILKSEQNSKKRKAESDPLPRKRQRTMKKGFLSERRYNSSPKLLRTKIRYAGRKPRKNYPQKNSSCDTSLDYGESNQSWSGSYEPTSPGYDPTFSGCSDHYVPDVKNTEPPYYVKQLASHADFANYDMGKLIGAGSFGEVIAATRKEDNKPVALKFVQKQSVKEFKELRGRKIPAEAYLQRQARHPNVIDTYKLIITDEYYCYVMERPEVCKDLFDILQDRNNEHRPLTEKEAKRYFAQILEANIRCEEKGVLHRDIKPENILVDLRTDEAKLIDFGLASEVQKEPFTDFRGENYSTDETER